MQLGVRADGQDGEHVPCYGDQVYDEEEDEEWLQSSGQVESPRRMNSETLLVWLSLSMIIEPTKIEKIHIM